MSSSIKDTAYKILIAPRLTEKASGIGSSTKGIVFEVNPRANKIEIKKAVEEVFDVKVGSVRTLTCVGGKKKRKGSELLSRKGSWKKAYVTLKEGSSLDIIEGL